MGDLGGIHDILWLIGLLIVGNFVEHHWIATMIEGCTKFRDTHWMTSHMKKKRSLKPNMSTISYSLKTLRILKN